MQQTRETRRGAALDYGPMQSQRPGKASELPTVDVIQPLDESSKHVWQLLRHDHNYHATRVRTVHSTARMCGTSSQSRKCYGRADRAAVEINASKGLARKPTWAALTSAAAARRRRRSCRSSPKLLHSTGSPLSMSISLKVFAT